MVSVLVVLAASITLQAPPSPAGASLVGAWTMNNDLSDARPDHGDATTPRDRGDDSGRGGGRGGHGGGRGGFRRRVRGRGHFGRGRAPGETCRAAGGGGGEVAGY